LKVVPTVTRSALLPTDVFLRRRAKRENRVQLHIRKYPSSLVCISLTAAQYYDSENISESRLGFRRATSEPEAHGRDDMECMKILYDMGR
jgi:hypothetical protein